MIRGREKYTRCPICGMSKLTGRLLHHLVSVQCGEYQEAPDRFHHPLGQAVQKVVGALRDLVADLPTTDEVD